MASSAIPARECGSSSASSSEPPNPKVGILIADDTRMGCQLLADALSRSRNRFEVVASAVSCLEALSSMKTKRVDVAIVNQTLQDGALLSLLGQMRTSFPLTRVVVLLKSPSHELVVEAFRAGAKGVFCRTESLETLCKCIQAVHSGQVWANSNQLHSLLETLVKNSPSRPVDHAGRALLTKRENDVASLLAEGFSNKEVSAKLGLSEHTVSNYLFRIYNKLGVSSRVELVLYLLRSRQTR